MAPKQKKRVSFSAGIETPDDLLSLPAVYRHPDPVLRRYVLPPRFQYFSRHSFSDRPAVYAGCLTLLLVLLGLQSAARGQRRRAHQRHQDLLRPQEGAGVLLWGCVHFFRI